MEWMRKKGKKANDEMREVRDRATAQSWPVNDKRANYPAAERYRRTRSGEYPDAGEPATTGEQCGSGQAA